MYLQQNSVIKVSRVRRQEVPVIVQMMWSIREPTKVLVYAHPASIPAKWPMKEALGTSKWMASNSAHAAYLDGTGMPMM